MGRGKLWLLLIILLFILSLAACGPGATRETQVNGVPIPTVSDIADGKSFIEGGSILEYTFRTLWKQALTEAQEWHQDAYLVVANGCDIDNKGIPAYWFLVFLSPSDELYRLDMKIDPRGEVIEREIWTEGSEEELRDYRIAYGDTPIPAKVVDSDVVVQNAISALSTQFKAEKIREPRAILSWNDESEELVWSYTFFYKLTAEYCGVDINPQTGKIKKVWRGSGTESK